MGCGGGDHLPETLSESCSRKIPETRAFRFRGPLRKQRILLNVNFKRELDGPEGDHLCLWELVRWCNILVIRKDIGIRHSGQILTHGVPLTRNSERYI